MNGLYICEEADILWGIPLGFVAKIQTQLDAFNRAGLNCSLACCKMEGYAERHIGIDSTIKNVIEYIKGTEDDEKSADE